MGNKLTYLLLFASTLHFGQTWLPLASGTDNSIAALKEDTANHVLYAGGLFNQAGGNSVSKIAKWDGTSWNALGSGLDQNVHALSIIGGTLDVGGEFLNAGGNPATRFAKYDGLTWTTLGNGIGGSVNAIAEYNGETYTGGFAGLNKWTGSTWIDIGIGGTNPYVQALKVYNGELYVAGTFGTAGTLTANGIAKWNGSSWSIPGGTGLNNFGWANALEIFNGELYVGGEYTTAGGVSALCLAKWNGTNWAAVGSGMTGGIGNSSIYTMKTVNNYLYLGGNFYSASGTSANFITKYDGSSFSNLGTGTNERVYSLDSYNGNLIAGGQFSQAGGITANNIAQWNIPPAGINELSNNCVHTLISPNPNSGAFKIQIGNEISDGKLILINSLGLKVFEQKIIQGENEIIAKGLSGGLYHYAILRNKQQVGNGKLIIE